MRGTLKRLWDGVLARSSTLRRLRSRLWYQYVSRKLGDEPVLFMNYGYAHLDDRPPGELHLNDEPERTAARLYQFVAGAVDLSGKDVVEVGCGRGGGASLVMCSLKPRSMLGIDHAEHAVGFARRRHPADGLKFSVGDAEKLPLEDRSVDVVINIESSHCYGDMEGFVVEVERVLRPGGHLLFADLGDRIRMARVREAFERSGLDIVREDKINANVLKAMEQDSDKKLRLVKRFAPWFLHGAGKEFAGLKKSAVYRMLRSEEILYMHYVLHKRADQQNGLRTCPTYARFSAQSASSPDPDQPIRKVSPDWEDS
jgi:ubiquinone/menaquinone biosynthesis C-methylase UbiE